MFPVSPPIRMDLFSIFILLGIVQGIFLSYFFISNSKGNRFPNLLLAILLFGLVLIMVDVWLGYTNYMFRVIWLVDATEPVNLILAPLTYLYIKTSISQRIEKNDWIHFIPPAFYFLYMCLMIYPQGTAFKYNANIGSYHPEIATIEAYIYGERWMFFLKHHINDFTFISMFCYDIAGFILLKNAYKKQGYSIFSKEKTPLSWYRKFHLQLLGLVLIFLLVKIFFSHDLGDHIIAACITLIIYATSITVFSRSLFFHENSTKSNETKKYGKSSLTAEIQTSTLRKLNDLMKTEKPFLDPGFSLPVLAKQLGTSTHHLSQILNEELEQTFFDLMASYRIAEAQKLLYSKESNFIKIEEIAQMVGYNSKSAFNTAFKKITGVTPSEFKKRTSETE
ncbi:AraC family transcriptional regulator [Dyadobacter sp. 3J3]|uniref:helix-turn-helix domain-containing protein n=1 Tax=Dyadobacter sp. 3J3 TaxID=2606600 RepID=UPI001E4CD449|nr:helix-turn-helix domain-containing protein [Dyadobacter sp. 3J3]